MAVSPNYAKPATPATSTRCYAHGVIEYRDRYGERPPPKAVVFFLETGAEPEVESRVGGPLSAADPTTFKVDGHLDDRAHIRPVHDARERA